MSPVDVSDGGFAHITREDELLNSTPVEVEGETEPSESDATKPNESGEENEEESSDSWDWSPPEAIPGARVTASLDCGFTIGTFRQAWTWDGAGWQQERGEDGPEPRPELTDCMGVDDEKELSWSTDGTLYFEAGAMAHTLWPTATENRWLGGVAPLSEPSAACQNALAAAGMTLPVTITLRVESVEFPSNS